MKKITEENAPMPQNDWQRDDNNEKYFLGVDDDDEKDKTDDDEEEEKNEEREENTDNDWGVVDPLQGPFHIPSSNDPSGPGSAV